MSVMHATGRYSSVAPTGGPMIIGTSRSRHELSCTACHRDVCGLSGSELFTASLYRDWVAILRRLDEISRRLGVAPRINERTASLWRVHLLAALVVVAAGVIVFVAGDYLLSATLVLIGGAVNGAWAWTGWAYQRQHRPSATWSTPSPPTSPDEHSS